MTLDELLTAGRITQEEYDELRTPDPDPLPDPEPDADPPEPVKPAQPAEPERDPFLTYIDDLNLRYKKE